MNGERTTGTTGTTGKTGTTANPFLHDRHDREPGVTREMVNAVFYTARLGFLGRGNREDKGRATKVVAFTRHRFLIVIDFIKAASNAKHRPPTRRGRRT